MTMRYKKSLFQAILITTWISVSCGCQMDGVTTWLTPVTTTVLDTHSGSFFNRATTDIVGINTITFGEGLNSGPYVQVTHSNSEFDITTNDAYRGYEENETAQSMTFTVVFGCTGGSTRTLVFIVNVIDTNNNPPQFLPNNQNIEFTITPPLPPGYQITGCLQDITVRDIDLTTQRIDFAIEPNEYFEIDYDASLSTDPKEFKAVLKTTTFIRTLSEPVQLIINATDVDLTGDPPITTSTTVRIVADSEFEFPEEPVFSQPFYVAKYEENQVTLDEPITLQQGFHELVQFSLEGEHSTFFDLQVDGNQLSLVATEPLSPELTREGRLILAVRAEREFTSGATATVVIEMPEVLGLRFESIVYEGKVVDDTMEPLQLILAEGYESEFSVALTGGSSAFFTTAIQGNIITLSYSAPLNTIEQNFISIQVSASNEFSTASAVVNLEVIRDDVITPAFEKAIYTGDYEPETGLTLEPITLVQGYDETVSFTLEGEHAAHFAVIQNGSVLIVTASPLPPQVLSERNLILSLLAFKPRTVGANTAIYIQLPPARELVFESSTYIGTLEENNLVLAPIIMSVGYGDDVSFSLSGDYATYFTVTNVQNQISLILSTSLPHDVISSENFLILALSASGELAETSSTVIILEILKQDTITPVFSQNVYIWSYSESNTEIGNISLIQGYDSSVSFRLDGDYATYFHISDSGNNILITMVSDIPEELIFDEKVLLFNIIADKPLTVGANAAIAIRFPPELTDLTSLKYGQNTYVGSVENNVLALENIILERGYNNGTEFTLSGAYASYFTFTSSENIVTISVFEPLPDEVLQTNRYIILELEAERYQAASAVASIIIDLLLPEVEQPRFGQPYYRGVYSEDSGLQMEQDIILTQGFDETVTFLLEGDSSQWFTLTTNGETVSLEINDDIPSQVIESNHQLLFTIVASKFGTPPGETVISIELHKEMEPVILRFEQNSYVGSIESGELQSPAMTLLAENIQQLQLAISGEYASYFTLAQELNNVLLQLNGTLPSEVDDVFIVLNIEVSSPYAISGYTTVVIEIVKGPVFVRPIFEQAYYVGEYSQEEGLLFEHSIQLIDGFDESVSFTLEGTDAQWFEINNNEDTSLFLTLINNATLPVQERGQLIFSVVANKLNSSTGRAAIVIILSDYPQTESLHFSQTFYKGTIENGNLTIEAISLDGYSADTDVSIAGDYVHYFQLLNQDGALSIELLSPLPNDVIDNNAVLIWTLEAKTTATSTRATIVIELLKDHISSMTFEEIYYVGSYSESSNLMFDSEVTLASGYEESVSFYLEGDDAQWFVINQTNNSVSLQMTAPIPEEVLLSRRQLIFVIVAENSGSSVRATIIIELLDEITEDFTLLSFENRSYIGSIENNISIIEPVTLLTGYSDNVVFSLSGGLSEYFTITNEGAFVYIRLEREIPEELLPSNRITVIELQASAPDAISGYTIIIFEFAQQEISQPIFSRVYYTGSYGLIDGIAFDEAITLSEGYDDNVEFDLQGDDSIWFGLDTDSNAASLLLTSPIPSAVLQNNQQLIFTVTASKPGAVTANATIVISLTDDLTESSLLGFNKISYLGSIENNQINLEQVILNEGYTENVTFTLLGDLASYFNLTNEYGTITLVLEDSIPEETMPENQIIILELQASAPQHISAYATIIFEVRKDETVVEDLLFGEVYFTGNYNEETGLAMDPISLIQGYDQNVTFALEGEQSQWFGLLVSENIVTLTLDIPIPPAILINNQQLIFIITAQKDGIAPTKATIVISLITEISETEILGFNKISYLGTIEDDQINLEQVILSEGYSENVTFTLLGDLSIYFNILNEEGRITIVLEGTLPEESIPSNQIIILEIQASAPQYISAYATIIFNVQREETVVEDILFGEVYYTGNYNEETGLVMDPISLTQGYDQNVTFALEGAQSQWFGLLVSENIVTLTLGSPIPPAILINNQQLIFIITAQKDAIAPTKATIVISLIKEISETEILGFNKISYLGTIEGDQINLEQVILSEGYSENVTFTLLGDLSIYFYILNEEGRITIVLEGTLPEESIPSSQIIILEIQASAPQYISAYATIIFNVQRDETVVEDLLFSEVYYTGNYNEETGLAMDPISLIQGYDQNVTFALEGEQSQWFGLLVSENIVTLTLDSPIPPAILINNQQLIFIITAQKDGIAPTKATIVISLINEISETEILGFSKISYLGTIEGDEINLEPVILSEGYSENVTFALLGDLSTHFNILNEEGRITILLEEILPEESIPLNRIIILELQASAPLHKSAYATLVLNVQRDEILVEEVLFSDVYYTGKYTEEEGLIFSDITLSQGFDQNVTYGLEGEQSQWFGLQASENVVILRLISTIPAAVVLNNQQLVFIVTARKPESLTANATIVISLPNELNEVSILGFNKISYLGTIDHDQVSLEPVVLSEGYNENVTFTLHGEFADLFVISSEEETVTVTLRSTLIENNYSIIVLEIQASAPQYVSAYATIVFEVLDNPAFLEELAFTELYYIGRYTEGELIFDSSISLSHGFDETVELSLEGENSQWFNLIVSDNLVTLTVSNIPEEVLENNQKLIFTIVAEKPGSPTARAVVIVSLLSDGETTPGVIFDRALYEGQVREGRVQHEPITFSGYDETEVEIFGTYAELFVASVSNGSVTVQGLSSVILAPDVVYVALELRTLASSTVLVLNVEHDEDVNLPTVTFGSTTYSITIDVSHTGFLGRVEATASNGEAVTYSLLTQDDHLSQRISVNQEGELHLSAPANSGAYSFEVVATTVFSRISGNAVVQLTVDIVIECGDDKVVPPLIIIDRDEEEPHRNLVVINEEHADCRYRLTNHWPIDQTWLYVDDTGLHANIIDREDESIAFMALSQIQVELLLECDSDNNSSTTTKHKRSLDSKTSLNDLGPYDYGDKSWILTESILYNSRRTLVNLIVNDINDNYPIFVGKDKEPITVGYPLPELEERVSPRVLIELQATDADVGENAALMYWSSDEVLAVSPTSGLVHVRQNTRLEDGANLSVFATDQNGQGLTGNLTLLVKLLDVTNIAVVTIRDAFLEDEETLLEEISTSVGYEVKALRATVVSDDPINNENALRKKRDVTTFGASLQMYVYGLIEREPVSANRLTTDLTNDRITTVTITRTISLEDHLEEMRAESGRDTGFLVATIVLSVLLFILIVFAAVWFFLKWRKERNYDKFKDENSIASFDELSEVPKPQTEVMPRLNIEELIKSERRLQERLEAPDVTVEPMSSKREPSLPPNIEPVIVPMPNTSSSIVIQDKLKDDGNETEDEDEFGERKPSRRKSVVTFNENVEKIIHVESSTTSDDDSSLHEVYKL